MVSENLTSALTAATDRAAVTAAALAQHEQAAQPLRNTFSAQAKLLPAVIEANRQCADARRLTEQVHERQHECMLFCFLLFFFLFLSETL